MDKKCTKTILQTSCMYIVNIQTDWEKLMTYIIENSGFSDSAKVRTNVHFCHDNIIFFGQPFWKLSDKCQDRILFYFLFGILVEDAINHILIIQIDH